MSKINKVKCRLIDEMEAGPSTEVKRTKPNPSSRTKNLQNGKIISKLPKKLTSKLANFKLVKGSKNNNAVPESVIACKITAKSAKIAVKPIIETRAMKLKRNNKNLLERSQTEHEYLKCYRYTRFC